MYVCISWYEGIDDDFFGFFEPYARFIGFDGEPAGGNVFNWINHKWTKRFHIHVRQLDGVWMSLVYLHWHWHLKLKLGRTTTQSNLCTNLIHPPTGTTQTGLNRSPRHALPPIRRNRHPIPPHSSPIPQRKQHRWTLHPRDHGRSLPPHHVRT